MATLCAAVAAHDARAVETCDEEIIFSSSGGVEADLRTGKASVQNVSISQCGVSIAAKRAEATGGLDFKNNHWVFYGDVRVTAPQRGSMQSDRADVEFRDDRIMRATIKGSPAQFEQKRKGSTELARGRAGTIVYEVAAGTVRFANDAWLSNGQNQISGPLLVYDMRSEKVQALTQAGGNERVRITIAPKQKSEGEPPQPVPAQAAPAPDGGADSAQ